MDDIAFKEDPQNKPGYGNKHEQHRHNGNNRK